MIWYLGLIFRHFPPPPIYFPYLLVDFPRSLPPRSFYPVHSFPQCATMSFSRLHVCYANFSHSSSIRRASQEHLRFQSAFFPHSFYPRLPFSPYSLQLHVCYANFSHSSSIWRASHGSQEQHLRFQFFFPLCPWNTIILLQRSALMYWTLFVGIILPWGPFRTIATSAV